MMHHFQRQVRGAVQGRRHGHQGPLDAQVRIRATLPKDEEEQEARSLEDGSANRFTQRTDASLADHLMIKRQPQKREHAVLDSELAKGTHSARKVP